MIASSRSALSHPRRDVARRRSVRGVAALLLGSGLWLAASLTAGAHVHVDADNPTAGEFSVLAFRVPNESDTAGTVKVAVSLPTDTPFLYVSTKPVPGWSVTAAQEQLPSPVEVEGTTVTKSVRTVTWTADKGVQIRPGEFQEFEISVGPLPEPTTIVLPAVQTYSDGEVVRWDQETPASGEEPERPAPEVVIVAGTGDPHEHDTQTAPASPAAGHSETPMPVDIGNGTGASGDSLALILGGLGLVVGGAALVLTLLNLRRKDSA